ncbi:MAG: single-stranded DNA-binding protein [Methylococcales bacterium]|nr:single-stranded DNA-binding protein [Methylococcales bacterium]
MSNVFSFTGAIVADAVVRYAASGTAILSVRVANNVGFGDKQQTLWIQVSLFGKRAESGIVPYLKKGQQVFISGELTTREYQANDGTTRTSLDLIANILDLVGSGRKPDVGQTGQDGYSAPASRVPSSTPAQPSGRPDNFNDAPYDDDIPF